MRLAAHVMLSIEDKYCRLVVGRITDVCKVSDLSLFPQYYHSTGVVLKRINKGIRPSSGGNNSNTTGPPDDDLVKECEGGWMKCRLFFAAGIGAGLGIMVLVLIVLIVFKSKVVDLYK